MDVTWLIGGPQGGGINASAEAFAKACIRAGFRVIANIEYHSNIMGEHSYYRVRISDEPRYSLSEGVHVLVALDRETLLGESGGEFPGHRGHLLEVLPGGAVIHDTELDLPAQASRDDRVDLAVPYEDLLRQALASFGREAALSRFKIMANTIAVGASAAALGLDIGYLQEVIREEFSGRRAELGEMNAKAALLGYEYVQEHYPEPLAFRIPKSPRAAAGNHRPFLVRGIQAAAIAKIKAGLAFQTYYPISPATDENVYLEAHQREYDLVVVQTEDEISAINMAVGAAHAGVRAATSTSGPGLSLMVEGLGFAAMTEAPGPVVFLWQRGGPSTGLPTRQEQSDLRFALQPSHGEFPHVVVAPGDVREIVEDCYEAFNWADRYQVPVVVLLDKALATTYVTVDDLGLERLPPIDRGPRFSPNGKPGDYLRYALTESGISPRSIPGQEGGIFWSTTDEHDPRGHITEEAGNRVAMMEKRMRKLELAAREIPAARKLALYGPEEADVTLVGWGSTKGVILDAMRLLAEEGLAVNFLQIRLLRPFPKDEVEAILGRAKRLLLVENNYSGQLGLLLREQTGIEIPQRVVKYDGRPFTQEELVGGLRAALHEGVDRVAVSHGLA